MSCPPRRPRKRSGRPQGRGLSARTIVSLPDRSLQVSRNPFLWSSAVLPQPLTGRPDLGSGGLQEPGQIERMASRPIHRCQVSFRRHGDSGTGPDACPSPRRSVTAGRLRAGIDADCDPRDCPSRCLNSGDTSGPRVGSRINPESSRASGWPVLEVWVTARVFLAILLGMAQIDEPRERRLGHDRGDQAIRPPSSEWMTSMRWKRISSAR